jgi:hypothetical protein
MVQYFNGSLLTPDQRRQALAMYVHRFTGQHVPEWARHPINGKHHYQVQFRDDADWLANTDFPITKAGKIASRGRCRSTPTWPEGEGFRDTPYSALLYLQGGVA